jgi:hypothetical protein
MAVPWEVLGGCHIAGSIIFILLQNGRHKHVQHKTAAQSSAGSSKDARTADMLQVCYVTEWNCPGPSSRSSSACSLQDSGAQGQ